MLNNEELKKQALYVKEHNLEWQGEIDWGWDEPMYPANEILALLEQIDKLQKELDEKYIDENPVYYIPEEELLNGTPDTPQRIETFRRVDELRKKLFPKLTNEQAQVLLDNNAELVRHYECWSKQTFPAREGVTEALAELKLIANKPF